MPELDIQLNLPLELNNAFKDAELLVGWFEDTKYADGIQVAAVAYQNEYGTDKIPARPFMRPAQMENENKWIRIAEKKTAEAIEKGAGIDYILTALGVVAVGDIQKAISDVYSPPLAKYTIEQRLRKRGLSWDELTDTLTKPLVDSGIMRSTVSFQIKEK